MKKILSLMIVFLGSLGLTATTFANPTTSSWNNIDLPTIDNIDFNKAGEDNPIAYFSFNEIQYLNNVWTTFNGFEDISLQSGYGFIYFDFYDNNSMIEVNIVLLQNLEYPQEHIREYATIKSMTIEEYKNFKLRYNYQINSDFIDITNWKDLPYAQPEQFIDIKIIEGDNFYYLIFDFTTHKFRLKVTELPHQSSAEFQSLDKIPDKIEYYTIDSTREIKYEWNSKSDILLTDVEKNIEGFKPFIVYNIDKDEITGLKKFLLHGVTFIQNDYVYVDLSIPFEIDDLLQVKVQYSVTSTSAFIFEKTKNYEVTRINGKTTRFGNYLDFMLKGFFVDHGSTANYFKQFVFNGGNDIEQVKRIDSYYSSETRKNEYLTKLNNHLAFNNKESLQRNDVFTEDAKMWRVALNYHHSNFQTKISVSDVTITELLYVYNGKYIYVTEKDIDSNISGGTKGQDLEDVISKLSKIINDAIKFFTSNANVIIKVLSLIGIVIAYVIFSPIFKVVFSIIKLFFKGLISILAKLFGWLF